MKENALISQAELMLQKDIAKTLKTELSGGKRCYIETYGCQMNVRDSESIYGILSECGYVRAKTRAEADLIIFNTCCVRDHAEKRVFGNVGMLKEQKAENPGLIIAVCGCMMQQPAVAKRLMKRFPYVSLVFGTHVLHRLPEFVKRVLDGERVICCDKNDSIAEGLPAKRDSAISAFVNITYGCDNFCSYCIVPYVRGRERSRSVEEILAEIEGLTNEGVKEITLLGQNVNSYRCGECDFASLLRQVSRLEGVKRIRFMSSHPKDLSDDVIAAIKECDKVCHHVHLPVQSGSSRILKLMNRKYTRESYLEIVEKLRAAVPDIELTTDIIVGFPGESEEDFDDTLSLVNEVGFLSAFTFKYSPRTGTKAADMEDQLPDAVKRDRLKRLNERQSILTKQNNEKYVGVEGELLVEGSDDSGSGLLYGKFSNFKMVYFMGSPELVGSFVRVKATKCVRNSLEGELVKE